MANELIGHKCSVTMKHVRGPLRYQESENEIVNRAIVSYLEPYDPYRYLILHLQNTRNPDFVA